MDGFVARERFSRSRSDGRFVWPASRRRATPFSWKSFDLYSCRAEMWHRRAKRNTIVSCSLHRLLTESSRANRSFSPRWYSNFCCFRATIRSGSKGSLESRGEYAIRAIITRERWQKSKINTLRIWNMPTMRKKCERIKCMWTNASGNREAVNSIFQQPIRWVCFYNFFLSFFFFFFIYIKPDNNLFF